MDVVAVDSEDSPLSTLVGPSLALVRGGDGVAEDSGGAGKDDGSETHFGR